MVVFNSKDSELVELKNGAPLNICYENRDSVVIGLQYCAYRERGRR